MATVHNFRFPLILVAALGCGLNAGVFFAFSTFVMPALARLQLPQGIAAMQSINITAINPLFMLALFGTAFACLFLAITVLFKWQQPSNFYLLAGSLLYLVGAIAVTIAFNVPLNYALAIVKPDSPKGATLWARYLTDWTFWNHIRTIAAFIAATLLTLSINTSAKL
jgi:uncharacterized membrane protein